MPKAKARVKADVDAVQAMQEALYHGQGKVVLQLDPETRRYIETFLVAFSEVKPDMPFSVLDVMGWACKYQAIRRARDADLNFNMPGIFSNAYALGKLLMKSQDLLGYQHAGSYGNRAIYSIGGVTDGQI